MKQFYKAGSFLDNSPVSDLELHVQIPDYTCPVCGSNDITTYYNYPHLNVGEVVSNDELKKLGPVMRIRGSGEEIADIVWRLRRKWNIPVSAGTIFGPTRVKVTSKPKEDFHVLVGHAGFFCKAAAALKLRDTGIVVDWVKTPAKGKYAVEADYVEIVVPVTGRQKVPLDRSFCLECLRYRPGGSFRTVLLDEHLPRDRPFFKTIESGVIIFSAGFISTVGQLGLSGFVEGKTLIPVSVSKEDDPWDIEYDRQLEEKREKDWQELLQRVEREKGKQTKRQQDK